MTKVSKCSSQICVKSGLCVQLSLQPIFLSHLWNQTELERPERVKLFYKRNIIVLYIKTDRSMPA